MGFLGIKSAHEKQTNALYTILFNLCMRTVEGGADAPLVLNFTRRDSLFRYIVFCMSAAHTACAGQMKNPDAVLNDVANTVVTGAVSVASKEWLGGPVENPQQIANEAAALLQDFLTRWSAYVDIVAGNGNQAAATGIVAEMILSTESDSPMSADAIARVWPLAEWIEANLPLMRRGFVATT